MSDAEFLQAFEQCTLPPTEWKHRAHVKIAYLYLQQLPLDDALGRIREGIKRYNAATDTPEALDRGYHETITQAWARLVYFTMCEHGPAASSEEFLERNPQLAQKNALRFFYSHDRIMSWQAKAGFVEPDLAPFPRCSKA